MNRLKRKLAVNGVATILSVIFILAMVAAPAVATIVANTVNSAAIIDGQVKTKDLAVGAVGTGRIKNKAVTGAKIKNYTITKYDIHSGSINKYKLIRGAVNSIKILDGSILARDIADGAVNSAKIADGSITNADIANGAAISASKINRTGLDADKLDGKNSTDFVQTTGDQSIDGMLTVSGLSYATRKTAYLSLGPADFDGWEHNHEYQKSAERLQYAGAGVGNFYAPVHLPSGAVVKSINCGVFDDTGDSDNVEATLFRVTLDADDERPSTPERFTMARTPGSVDSDEMQTISNNSIDWETIDNSSNTYVAYFTLDPETEAMNFVIEYEYLSPSP